MILVKVTMATVAILAIAMVIFLVIDVASGNYWHGFVDLVLAIINAGSFFYMRSILANGLQGLVRR